MKGIIDNKGVDVLVSSAIIDVVAASSAATDEAMVSLKLLVLRNESLGYNFPYKGAQPTELLSEIISLKPLFEELFAENYQIGWTDFDKGHALVFSPTTGEVPEAGAARATLEVGAAFATLIETVSEDIQANIRLLEKGGERIYWVQEVRTPAPKPREPKTPKPQKAQAGPAPQETPTAMEPAKFANLVDNSLAMAKLEESLKALQGSTMSLAKNQEDITSSLGKLVNHVDTLANVGENTLERQEKIWEVVQNQGEQIGDLQEEINQLREELRSRPEFAVAPTQAEAPAEAQVATPAAPVAAAPVAPAPAAPQKPVRPWLPEPKTSEYYRLRRETQIQADDAWDKFKQDMALAAALS